jgi:selenocysteine lyase/cysteine desulfurase
VQGLLKPLVVSWGYEAEVAALKAQLYDDYRIEVPLIERNGCKLIRVSIQGYNRSDDVERLLEALRALL